MKIVIADDHYLVREGTRRLLESSGGVDVLAAVENTEALLDAVDRLRPDAVITDIRMPPTNQMEGIEAAHEIRSRHPDVGVVVLSQYVNSLYAFELFRDGTSGLAYLLKDRVGELDELLRALGEVAAGGSVIDPKVVEVLLGRRQQPARSLLETLSAREMEVLSEMAQGESNAAISSSLYISPSAVEKHINAIFAKLMLSPQDGAQHRRVSAVLTFLRNQDLRGSPEPS
ncbi:MAG TPA: response regulator transcription factor [Verrucomicrobiae bacterium]|nr:response regulator transcription factor [Verrucomicrobiae bacterium]